MDNSWIFNEPRSQFSGTTEELKLENNGGQNVSRLASLRLDLRMGSSQCAIKGDNSSNVVGSWPVGIN